jgi:hypothetical protein
VVDHERNVRKVAKTSDICERVEAELIFDPIVDARNITVKNMGGEVALNGWVPTYPQYLGAEAAAQRVAGVTNVRNHLEVVLMPGDYRDDAMLTTSANNALTRNITVPDGVEATARNGNPRPPRRPHGWLRRAARLHLVRAAHDETAHNLSTKPGAGGEA